MVMVERRGADRRLQPTPMLCRFTLLGGRRIGGRRVGETSARFVDQHGTLLFLAASAIVMLNLLDAWFTLLFLSYGGHELNPVVGVMLGYGSWPFVLFKTLGIGVCVAFLALTKNFFAARLGIALVLAGYLVLLGWHLYLLEWLSR